MRVGLRGYLKGLTKQVKKKFAKNETVDSRQPKKRLIYNMNRKDENLVLYTCYYEQTALGNVKKRFFVCADYFSGPLIDKGVTG